MRLLKKISLFLIILTLVVFLWPQRAYAATSFQVESIYVEPNTLAPNGGAANLVIKIKNTGTVNITKLTYGYNLNSGFHDGSFGTSISPNSTMSFTIPVSFKENDLGVSNTITIWITTSEDSVYKNASFIAYKEDNIIRSGGSVEPEKESYFVGETVLITDTMRNSLSINVTDAKMQYYFRDDTATYDGQKVSFGTISSNKKVENTLEYTFTEEDIGELRIGSYISYYVSGNGPYKEYNVAHDFIIEPSPSPTPTMEPTQTETPEPIQTETPIPDSDETQKDGVYTELTTSEVKSNNQGSFQDMFLAEDNNSNVKNETSQNKSLFDTIASDKALLITSIIVGGFIIILIIVLIIIIISKRK